MSDKTAVTSTVQRYGLGLILTAFVGLGILYDITVPFFEKPDELKHFAVIQHIQNKGQLPVVRAGVYKPWDQEGTQPPLYHVIAAGLTSWLDLSDFTEPPRNPHYADDRSFVWRERGNNNLYLHSPGETWHTAPVFLAARLARWLSLAAGVGTLLLIHRLASLIFTADAASPLTKESGKPENQRFTKNHLPLIATALVAFIPQYLHVSSAITNDSLSVTLAAGGLLLLALILKEGGSIRYSIWLGIILGLGAITKLSLLYLAPLIALVYLYDLWRHRVWQRFILSGLIISGLTLLISGWWFWRNWHLYGDITALNAHLLYRGGALNPRPTLAQIWQTELVGLELSFWAAFGAGQILLEPWLYTLLRAIKYLVLLGFLLGLWRHFTRSQAKSTPQPSTANSQPPLANYRLLITDNWSLITHHSSLITILLTLWTLLIFIALLRWMQITPAALGRLLYPTLPALAILTTWSLSQFRLPLKNKEATRYTLPLLLLIFLFSLALISPFRYIQTAYAKTPLITEAEVPLDTLTKLDWVYDHALHLLGYRIERPTIQAGEWLPVTLYWQATRPLSKNYSGFVHLLDQNGQAIAQANTYPDGGKWPTSMLPPGQVLADTYYIFVPLEADTQAPFLTRLAMGIFAFEDPARTAKPAITLDGQVVKPLVEGVPLLPHQWPTLTPDQPLGVEFGGQIQLIGIDSVHETWQAGEQIPLTLYWETLAPPGQDLTLFIQLLDSETQHQIAGFDGPPAYPTRLWQSGNTFTDPRLLTLSSDIPAGEYQLLIGWYDPVTFARLPTGDGDAVQLLSLTIVNES